MIAAPLLFSVAELRARSLATGRRFTSERLLHCTVLASQWLFSTPGLRTFNLLPPSRGGVCPAGTSGLLQWCWDAGFAAPELRSGSLLSSSSGELARSCDRHLESRGSRETVADFSSSAQLISASVDPRVPAVLRCWGRELLCSLG
ncbi:hypothetical protein NDU88_000578 [Pleurodeles waltl]|uniref:Secreted protein n=1 Tax=Pleurodeles waltl TaxID=8319 RepID=A0AAV7URH0_PLEWA|nr:hypothetical protein NDU88_000578 [Pleurodeles waltl]